MKAIIAAAVLAAGLAHGAGFELKGIRLGEPEAELKAAFPTLRCGDAPDAYGFNECVYAWTPYSEAAGSPVIHELDTVAGARASTWSIRLHDGKVGMVLVTLNPADFDQVGGALRERYGQPAKTSTATLRNGFGAPFRQVEQRWSRGGQTIQLSRYGADVETMPLVVASDTYLARLQARDRLAQKRGAGDL